MAARQVSRRGFLRLAGAITAGAVAATAGAACAPSEGSPAPRNGEKVQLVYQDWGSDWFPTMVQEMLDQFHAQHPNIRVFFTPDPEDLENQMLADFQAGTAPDVFQGSCTHFPTWAQKGYTLDLRPYVAADLDQATIDDWDRAQYNSLFSRDGRQFGLPKYHGALALYYNRDLFARYHHDYPDSSWNHDDYLQAMKRLTYRLGRPGESDVYGQTDRWGSLLDISWERLQVHVNGWGGHFVDPTNPTRCMMCQPEAMEAMEWIRARMWDEGTMATPRDVQKVPAREAFAAGVVAMVEDGSWALKDILAGSSFRIGVAPFPSGPARRVTLAGTDGYGIYAGTRYPDAAWELLKFLVSKEYGRAMARASFLQPARASLVDEWAGYIRQQFPEKARDLDIAAFAEGHLQGYSVTTEIAANMLAAEKAADAAWEQIFALGKEPVQRMADACRLIEAEQR